MSDDDVRRRRQLADAPPAYRAVATHWGDTDG